MQEYLTVGTAWRTGPSGVNVESRTHEIQLQPFLKAANTGKTL